MLDNLLNSMKGDLVGSLVEKAGINADQAASALPLAGDSVKEGIMGAISGGGNGISDVMGMFSGGGGNFIQNAIYKNIAGNFISKLTGKLGLPESVAGMVSSTALPMIMNKIQGDASGDDGNVDQNKLMGMLGMDSGSVVDNLKDQAMDAVKDKLGGIGKLFG